MVYGAIDLHMRYSQIRIVDDTGAVLRDQRGFTSRERPVQYLVKPPGARGAQGQ